MHLLNFVSLQWDAAVTVTEEVMAGFMYLNAVEQYLQARTSSNRGRLDVADVEMSDRFFNLSC